MAQKLKLAVNWAGACGGCDVSLLDIEEKLLELLDVAELVFWPVAMDFKRTDLAAWGAGEIDVGIFNGVIRTSEHEEDARLLRERCKVLVAYGACAAYGGIPGLGNLHHREEILDRVYVDTPSTDNPEATRPRSECHTEHGALELPEFQETVRALTHVVEVDFVVPGCPPTQDRILELAVALRAMAETGSWPDGKRVLASEKALCDECPRVETRTGRRVSQLHRPHEVVLDPELCFLEQGVVCGGMATRGGCGASCIRVNMPCRGCFGTTDSVYDPGAEALSALGSLAARDDEDHIPAGRRLAPLSPLVDLAGTFYRFTLPSSILFRAVKDEPDQ